jgi:hypothetical protein
LRARWAILGHLHPDARLTARRLGIKILRAKLCERREMLGERRLVDLVGELRSEPRIKAVEGCNEGDDRAALLSWI